MFSVSLASGGSLPGTRAQESHGSGTSWDKAATGVRVVEQGRQDSARDVRGTGFFLVEARRLNAWTAALWGAWACGCSWAYFAQSPAPFYSLDLWLKVLPPVWDLRGWVVVGHAAHVVQLGLFVLTCVGVGWALLRSVFGAPSLNALETAAFSFGLGTGAVGTVMALLGLAGLWTPPVILGMSVSGLGAAVFLNLQAVRRASTEWRRGSAAPGLLADPGSWPMAAMAALALGVTGFAALGPELFYDSLVYHLATPSLYKLSGGWVPTPTNLYSGFPMHTEMLFGWALFAGDSVLARLLHWSMGLGCAVAMLGLGVRSGRPRAGWLACALFLATPLVGMSLFKTAVEGCTVFMTLLLAHSLLLWLGAPAGSRERRGLWLLSAVFTGLAMSTKYTSWPVLLVLVAAFAWRRVPWRAIAAHAGVALAFLLPWVARNIWFYGNPVFPYLHAQLQPDAEYPANWRALQADAWARDWGALLSQGGQPLLQALAHPWFMTLGGTADADFLGPVFLMGLPALVLFRPSDRPARLLLALLAALWWLWWPATAMPRFFMPGLLLLSLWMAWALDALPARWRQAATVALVPLLLNNLFWVSLTVHSQDTWRNTVYGEDPALFLNHSHDTYPSPYFSSAAWLNEHAPPDARVLLVGEGRGFYLERRFMAASALDDEILPLWLKASPDAKALKARMEREGITHWLVNLAELARLKRDPLLAVRELNVLADFLRNFTQLRYEDRQSEPRGLRWTLVYEVTEPPPGAPQGPDPLLAWYQSVLNARP